jgi:DNA-binding beta-propeller fold protein YncE
MSTARLDFVKEDMMRIVFLMTVVALWGLAVGPARAAVPLYRLVETVPLGGGVKWDYLAYDAASGRVYVSHGDEVTVVDARRGKVVGQLSDLPGSHGIAVDPVSRLVYADSAGRSVVVAFNPTSFAPVASAPVLDDADGVTYDPFSRQVFVSGGDGDGFTPVSTVTGKAAAKIDLGTAPEFHVADGKGSVYVDLVDAGAIARIDSLTDKVIATWPVAPCAHPKGLAIDPVSRRLFASCGNGVGVVVDADSGKVLAALPIGKGTDAARFDAQRKRFLASNGDGTLSVIGELGGGEFVSLGTVKTALGARTLALDPATGWVFLVTATVTKTTPPATPGDHPHYTFAPGSLKLLVFAPAGAG